MPSVACVPDWTNLLPSHLRVPVQLGRLALVVAIYVHRYYRTPAASDPTAPADKSSS